MQVAVSTIISSAIDLADMRNSAFVDQANSATGELMLYVNMAYKDLYAQICMSKETYFTIGTPISITSGTDTYSLPDDFYKLDGVDLILDSSGRAVTLRPFQFAERNKFKSGLSLTTAPFGAVYRYMIRNNKITMVPIPSQSATITCWYTPEPVVIADTSTALGLPIGGDEYMSLYLACLMLTKEESDCSALDAKRREVLQQMKTSLKDRDQGAASYIVDESMLNEGIYPYRGMF